MLVKVVLVEQWWCLWRWVVAMMGGDVDQKEKINIVSGTD
jgi:hypothetical protein